MTIQVWSAQSSSFVCSSSSQSFEISLHFSDSNYIHSFSFISRSLMNFDSFCFNSVYLSSNCHQTAINSSSNADFYFSNPSIILLCSYNLNQSSSELMSFIQTDFSISWMYASSSLILSSSCWIFFSRRSRSDSKDQIQESLSWIWAFRSLILDSNDDFNSQFSADAALIYSFFD